MAITRTRHRLERPRALRSMPALVVATAFALAMPGAGARADQSLPIADVAGIIGHGLVTVVQEGLVSWYGNAFHNRPTASGELFDAADMTMAHPTLPFGTHVKVTNVRNGRSVVVRVNDRGPFVGSRIADLSRAAAEQLGMLKRGVVKARIEVVDGTESAAAR